MPFDPDSFLNQSTDSALSTRTKPCPAGEHPAFVKSVEMREFTYKKSERAGQTGYSMDVQWIVTNAAVQAELGFQPQVRQSFILDITPAGGLDTSEGKNTQLGRLREALRQNTPGKPWSPKMMEGQPAVIFVEHRMDGDDIYADVKKVRAA